MVAIAGVAVSIVIWRARPSSESKPHGTLVIVQADISGLAIVATAGGNLSC
jgi:hypothetical protein